mmetsp:Transcript_79306/g.96989  ORF Transcript_79306/g.96989 Transcript_79306/m.96989 type:complete len:238 (+) Transcript_79306:50-763(+)
MGKLNCFLSDKCFTFKSKNGTKPVISVKSFHVSCQSDLIPKFGFPSEPMIGIILYSKDGKTEWIHNGIKCKAGYIIIKKASNIRNIQSGNCAIQCKLYKSIFGCEPKNIVGAGFGFYNDKWIFKSFTFNTQSTYDGDTYHNVNREMCQKERICLGHALYNYSQGNQTSYVKDIGSPFKWISLSLETSVSKVISDDKADDLSEMTHDDWKKMFKYHKYYNNDIKTPLQRSAYMLTFHA